MLTKEKNPTPSNKQVSELRSGDVVEAMGRNGLWLRLCASEEEIFGDDGDLLARAGGREGKGGRGGEGEGGGGAWRAMGAFLSFKNDASPAEAPAVPRRSIFLRHFRERKLDSGREPHNLVNICDGCVYSVSWTLNCRPRIHEP